MSHKRSLHASLAANVMWGHCEDRTACTLQAREGLLKKLERQADPRGIFPAEERAKMVKNLRQAHMQKMSMKATEARKRKTEAKKAARENEITPSTSKSTVTQHFSRNIKNEIS